MAVRLLLEKRLLLRTPREQDCLRESTGEKIREQ